MTKKQIKSVVNQLVEFIIKDTTNNRYGLSTTHYFWPETKKWEPKIAEFDDVGDFLTFVAWAGKIWGSKAWLKFVNEQIKKWEKLGRLASGWWRGQIDCSNRAGLRQKLVVSIYGLQDAVLGFYELSKITNNKKYLVHLVELLKKLRPIVENYGGKLPNQVFNYLNWATPWTSTNPAVAGLIAEHAYLVFEEIGEGWSKELGDMIISGWTETSLWRDQSLFHQGYHSYLHGFSPYTTTKIMKENSNMIYAMLMKSQQYEGLMDRFVKQILKFRHSSGAFFGWWDVQSSVVIKEGFDKTQNFTIIDLLIDIATRSKGKRRQLIKAAVACANFWIGLKSKSTSLIPDYIRPNGQPQYQIAKLDQSADLYSSFLRLYSVTDERKYLEEAEIGARALSEYFGQSDWWHRIVNIKTGKPARDDEVPKKDRPAGRNLTKYVGGALRFYLSLYEVKSGKNMQQDKLLWLMSRDR